MTNRAKLAAFLKDNPGSFYCDDCLEDLVPVKNRRQVNQITGPLEFTADFARRDERCSHCRHDKKCVAYCGVTL